jgi:tetratricopeptide (TPR) repeat protein
VNERVGCSVGVCNAARRYEEAATDFTRALEVAPQSALALCNRGMCSAKIGALDIALQDFNAALDIDERNVDCLMTRGGLNRKLGCLAEAVHDFSRVIEIQPHNSRALVNRAMVYERANDLQAAVVDCRRALQIDPCSAKAHFCLGLCLEREDDDESALDAISRAIELESNVAYFNARGMLYDKIGQFDLCIQDFNNAIGLDPTNDALLHNRGACGLSLIINVCVLMDICCVLIDICQVTATEKTADWRLQ